MSVTPQVYAKARSEIIALFGWNADSLSASQMLRIDCATALRLALDDLQGKICRGETIDVARMLSASEALADLLPRSALAAPPPDESHHQDPRLVMWQIYRQMRERGEIGLKALAPQDDVATLKAENERLKAQLAGRGGSTAIDLAEADITPPGEIGSECYAGIRPGPDDPPRRSPPVIEGRAVAAPPAASAAAGYDYNANQDWKNFVEPDGSIRTTPRGRGHYWGPV
jgi:hypothetical protein